MFGGEKKYNIQIQGSDGQWHTERLSSPQFKLKIDDAQRTVSDRMEIGAIDKLLSLIDHPDNIKLFQTTEELHHRVTSDSGIMHGMDAVLKDAKERLATGSDLQRDGLTAAKLKEAEARVEDFKERFADVSVRPKISLSGEGGYLVVRESGEEKGKVWMGRDFVLDNADISVNGHEVKFARRSGVQPGQLRIAPGTTERGEDTTPRR